MVGGVAQLVRNGLQDQYMVLKAEAQAWKRRAVAEVKQQAIDTSVTIGIAMLGVFLGLLTIIVGLIALYVWVAANAGPFVAFAAVGGATAGLAIFMFLVAAMRARRGPDADSAVPLSYTATARTAKSSLADAVKYDAARTATAASDAVRASGKMLGNSSREVLVATIALAMIAGFVAGRRVSRPRH
jgi:uncharacterized membrane protein YbhN (UPF0104 family)